MLFKRALGCTVRVDKGSRGVTVVSIALFIAIQRFFILAYWWVSLSLLTFAIDRQYLVVDHSRRYSAIRLRFFIP